MRPAEEVRVFWLVVKRYPRREGSNKIGLSEAGMKDWCEYRVVLYFLEEALSSEKRSSKCLFSMKERSIS